jgi:hypothetical protein
MPGTGSEKVKGAELAHLMFFPEDFAADLMPHAINGLALAMSMHSAECREMAELALVSLHGSVGFCPVLPPGRSSRLARLRRIARRPTQTGRVASISARMAGDISAVRGPSITIRNPQYPSEGD